MKRKININNVSEFNDKEQLQVLSGFFLYILKAVWEHNM